MAAGTHRTPSSPNLRHENPESDSHCEPSLTQQVFSVWIDRALVSFFLVFLWLPVLDRLFNLDSMPPPQENRRPAPFPDFELSWESFQNFPKSFEAYFNDHFGMRNTFIRRHNQIKYRLLRVAPNPEKVLLGKDGWVFENGENLGKLIRFNAPLTQEELRRFERSLETMRRWLRKRGVFFLVVFVPEAWSVYPEYLPDSFNRVGTESRTDQVVRYMKDHSRVPFIDLKPILMDAKSENLIYRPLDPHWNQEGAFVAYKEILRHMKPLFPELPPLEDSRITRRSFEAPGGYLNRALSLPYDLLEVYHRVEVATPSAVPVSNPYDEAWSKRMKFSRPADVEIFERKSGKETLPTLVFFHDSYGNALVPYLKEHFGRTVSVRWPPFSRRIVEEEKPDIVICEYAERNVTLRRVSYR